MHRRFSGCEGYRFLPPFFFAPLAAFFAIVVYPPFHSWDSVREGLSLHCSAAAIRRAGLLLSAPRRLFAGTSASAEGVHQKIGGAMRDTPGPVGDQN
jgi:hypothetical protein